MASSHFPQHMFTSCSFSTHRFKAALPEPKLWKVLLRQLGFTFLVGITGKCNEILLLDQRFLHAIIVNGWRGKKF